MKKRESKRAGEEEKPKRKEKTVKARHKEKQETQGDVKMTRKWGNKSTLCVYTR